MGGFNGSGTYVRYYNWTNDANASIDISSSRMDTEDNGYATGLSTCITKDGQQTITANIPWNGKKITGLGAGTLATDASQLGQLSKGTSNYAIDSGITNAIVISMSPVNTALTDGQRVYFMAANNNTGATTLAVDGLGSTPALVNRSLAALAGGEILTNVIYEAAWSATNSKWILMGQSNVKGLSIASGKTLTVSNSVFSVIYSEIDVLGVADEFERGKEYVRKKRQNNLAAGIEIGNSKQRREK